MTFRRSWIPLRFGGAALAGLNVVLLATPTFAQHVIRNDMTGGDCEIRGLGVWSPTTRTCKLSAPLEGTIELASDDLTLDGADNIVKARPGDTKGVWANGRSRVTVTNTSFVRQSVAIGITGGSGHRVVKNTVVAGTADPGGDECGISLQQTSGNWVTDNKVIAHDGGEGICLLFADRNELKGNLSRSNRGANILLESSNGNTLDHNTVTTRPGVVANGIELRHSNDNTLTWNTASDHRGAGIDLSSSDRNLIAFNTLKSNARDGINLAHSKDNQILCNDSTDNSLGVDLGAGAVNNTVWRNNFFAEDDSRGPGANFFHRPAPAGGNYWRLNAPACVDANADGFCDAPYVLIGNRDALPHVNPIAWRVDPAICEPIGVPHQQYIQEK